MLFSIVASVLLGLSLSAEETEWNPITRGVETISFPIKETQLQIKSYRPPEDGSPGVVDKSTSMVMMLMLKGQRVATIVWNTVPYKEGRDITIFGCQTSYMKYKSDPCDGATEQVWTWHFTPERATLKCFDKVQYEMDFASTTLPYCKAIARTDVDQIKFTNMAGFSYRALPVQDVIVDQPQEEPQDLSLLDHRPTCDCWNHECDFCNSLECAVKYNVSSSSTGITVRSELKRSKTEFKKIMLYNGEGDRIGFFMFNRRAIFLEGCVYTRSPRLLIPRGEAGDWTFSLVNGVLQVEMEGEVVVDIKLRKGCADYYSDVQYFAFKRMKCADSFKVLPESMEVGSLIRHSRLTDYFPEYTGDVDNPLEARDFILQMFRNNSAATATEAAQPPKPIYSHFTCATDTQNIKFVFNSVRDHILHTHLREFNLV